MCSDVFRDQHYDPFLSLAGNVPGHRGIQSSYFADDQIEEHSGSHNHSGSQESLTFPDLLTDTAQLEIDKD